MIFLRLKQFEMNWLCNSCNNLKQARLQVITTIQASKCFDKNLKVTRIENWLKKFTSYELSPMQRLFSVISSTPQPLPRWLIWMKEIPWMFFLWWSRFEPRTLHILCLVLTNRAKLTRTCLECFYIILIFIIFFLWTNKFL